MKWGRVVLVALVIAGVLVPWSAPVARAASYTTAPTYYSAFAVSGGAFELRLFEYEQYYTGMVGYMTGGTCSLIIDGVEYQNGGGVGSTAPYRNHPWVRGNGIPSSLRDGKAHSVTISNSGISGADGTTPVSWVWTGTLVIPSGTGAVEGFASTTTYVAPSVVISGGSTVRVGQSYTYTAIITGGTAPYSVVFQRVSTAHPSDDYTYAAQVVSGTTASQVMEFPRVDSAWEVGVTVTDSLGTVASDSMVVNAASEKPVVYAGIKWTNNGQDDLLEFRVSTSAFGGVWKSDAESLPTEGGAGVMWYTVLTPAPYLRASRYFVLRGGNPPANPYTVMISLVDEAGTDWTYVFSFDTSTMSGPGDWVDTTGGGGSESTLPSWLESLIAALRNMLLRVWEVVKTALVDMFKWLFVPTDAQVSSLLPSGTMGATLLQGLPVYEGADTASYTLHVHWTVGGEVKQIDLMTLDLASLADNGFVKAVKLAVQGVMSIALVMMVVTLI